MLRILHSLIMSMMVITSLSLPAVTAGAQPAPAQAPICPGAIRGSQKSGAVYQVCMPAAWNGDLVVFAHGYVDPAAPIGMPYSQLTLPDGTNLPRRVTRLGYAFAVSSYSKNGLAVTQGVADSADLVAVFKAAHPETKHVYLVGMSEGGLITTLSIERKPEVYSGGVTACGPIGDFRRQVNHFGDFRVLFDYFYPGVPPGSAVTVPPALYAGWYGPYTNLVLGTIKDPANQHKTEQLLRMANAPIAHLDHSSVATTVLGILDYNVRATEDAKATLTGQPFDNLVRWYMGSDNDGQLNRMVQRFRADQPALQQIATNYQTSGKLSKPLVSLHTTGDPIVPFWHEELYWAKTLISGSALNFVDIPVLRYGHCNFRASEALAAFALMVFRVTGQLPAGLQAAVRSTTDQAEFTRLIKEQIGK